MKYTLSENPILIRVRNPMDFSGAGGIDEAVALEKGIYRVDAQVKGKSKSAPMEFWFDREVWTESQAFAYCVAAGFDPTVVNLRIAGKMQDGKFELHELRAAEKDGKRIIEGWASTPDVDWYNEVVLSTAFTDTLGAYLQFPILLRNHEWRSLPIGGVEKAEIKPAGLWIEAEIDQTRDGNDVWILIQKKRMKSFSIGFNSIRREYDEETKQVTHTKVELLEISVVNVPANRGAMFEVVAKARGIGFRQSTESAKNETTHLQPGGVSMPFTQEELQKIVADGIRDNLNSVAGAATKAATDATNVHIEAVKKDLAGIVKELRDMKEGHSPAELKAAIDRIAKCEDAIAASERDNQKIIGAMGEPVHFPKAFEVDARKHPYGPDYGSALTMPSEYFGKNAELHAEWAKAHDDLYLTMKLLGISGKQVDILDVKKRYDAINAHFLKAMSTETGYGGDFIPTALSGEYVKAIEAATVVAQLIPTVAMPTDPYKTPLKTGRLTVYAFDESTTDFPEEIRKSTATTGYFQLTAKGFAVHTTISMQETEDSIIPVLPMLRQDIVESNALAIDDAIINGDTSATHRDTGFSAQSWDHRKRFVGLRYQANADGAEYNAQTVAGAILTADFEAADFVWLWKELGVVGDTSRMDKLVFIMSLDKYLEAMLFEEILKQANFGAEASISRGPVKRIFGINTVTSGHIRNDYTSTGLYTGSASPATSLMLMLHTAGFIQGTRRSVTIKTDENIKTDQLDIVSTQRRAFNIRRAVATEIHVAAMRNIPNLTA